jgi:hypothetical protein
MIVKGDIVNKAPLNLGVSDLAQRVGRPVCFALTLERSTNVAENAIQTVAPSAGKQLIDSRLYPATPASRNTSSYSAALDRGGSNN